MMAPQPVATTRQYLVLLGVLLIAQGAGSIVRQAARIDAGWLVNGLMSADPLHGTIQILWGATMLAMTVVWVTDRRVALLAVVFGVFYVGLAILGVATHNPFGLHLGTFENAFHWTVGPLALAMGVWATRS